MQSRLKEYILRIVHAPTAFWVKIEFLVFFAWLRRKFTLPCSNRIKPTAQFLNVGCGSRGLKSKDWVNVDLMAQRNVDITCNAGRQLPFRNARFQAIFAEHFLEHMPLRQRDSFLRECLRVLKPGGVLRVSVPDGERYLMAYRDNPSWLMEHWGDTCRTPMQVVNRVFRQGYEHQFCYDFETLSICLKEAGFENVQKRLFREGMLPEILLDREDRQFESLYAEGTKPTMPSGAYGSATRPR